MFLKFLTHPITKIVLSIFGFIASFDWVRSMSRSFNFYVSQMLGRHPIYLGYVRVIAPILLTIWIFLLVLGVWHTRKKSILHKLDISLLAMLGVCLLVFCTRLLFVRFFSVFVLLLAPTIVYFFAVFMLIQVIVRMRDNSLIDTFYWWKFFNQTNNLPKVAMGALLTILIALLATESLSTLGLFTRNIHLASASIFWQFHGRWFSPTPLVTLFICIAIAFCALNYFAAYVLGLSSQYEQANTEKIRAERFKAELITNVSHDIRTPLTSIISYTGLLKQQQLQGDTASYVNVLDKKSIRLKQLLNDLIDASQASAGSLKANMEPLNLTEMLGQVAGEFSDIFDQNDLTLVLRQPTELLYVSADSRHLYRTMENIFSNAAKYSLPGTRVFAEIEKTSQNVILTLRNTSKNPIDAPAETLTDQFIRGDLARHSEGSGLGLYIAKSLVELMRGQLEIRLRGDLFEVQISLLKS